MEAVAEFYNKRHERGLVEAVENEVGRKVIDIIFQDTAYFLTDHYKDLLTKEQP